jgi:hypothetical protein
VQNRAIEALTEKFARTQTPFIVGGRRPSGMSLEWTLDAQVDRDRAVVDALRGLQRVSKIRNLLNAGLLQLRAAVYVSEPTTNSIRARKRQDLIQRLTRAATAEELEQACGLREDHRYKQWLSEHSGLNAIRRRKSPSAQRELRDLVADYVRVSTEEFTLPATTRFVLVIDNARVLRWRLI